MNGELASTIAAYVSAFTNRCDMHTVVIITRRLILKMCSSMHDNNGITKINWCKASEDPCNLYKEVISPNWINIDTQLIALYTFPSVPRKSIKVLRVVSITRKTSKTYMLTMLSFLMLMTMVRKLSANENIIK